MREIYTVTETAKILRVSPKTVYRIIRSGDLQAIRVRGQYRVTAEALRQYLKGGT